VTTTNFVPRDSVPSGSYYAYSGNEPVRRADPLGLDWEPVPGTPDFPTEDKGPTEEDYIRKWFGKCIKQLEPACDKYCCCKDCPPERCKKAAASLCDSYVRKFREHVSKNRKFQVCADLATTIHRFNLSNDCFKVFEAGNLKATHGFAAVFHVCNKTTNADLKLDPWRWLPICGEPWAPYHPKCKPGGPCIPFGPWPPRS
jgi:hypothetical protein